MVLSATQFRQDLLRHVSGTLGMSLEEALPRDMFRAVALTVRDAMAQRLVETRKRYRQADAKRVYYLSMEFLIGRSLVNNLVNLGLLDTAREVLKNLGFDLAEIEAAEGDAALGNGGLGRLAACFLDSMATVGLPGFGYGINYEYGLFKQDIRNGEQVEKPDAWRAFDTPWAISRPQDAIVVPIYGRVEHASDRKGQYNPMWLDWRVLLGVPHDMPVAGFGGKSVNYLRLYSARASEEMDIDIFNEGDYINAVEQKVLSETVTKILYPSESVAAGRELRLVQEYFLVACAMRDIVNEFRRSHIEMELFPDKVAIQLNDTHPSLAVAELMRLLVDEFDIPWDTAWKITTDTFAYTNHTLLPEALERWPVALFEKVLPRHLQVIYEINHRFLELVDRHWPRDDDRKRRMSLIEEGPTRQVRMAHLAIVGSHSINGVAQVHSKLVQRELVPDFYDLWPERFNNKTNGVTPRRWIFVANPELTALVDQSIGTHWRNDLERLRDLEPRIEDASFRDAVLAVKRHNKDRLARIISATTGVTVDSHSLFDVQVKRIHEYKRQLLNLLHIVHEYLRIVEDGHVPAAPRTYLLAGKAAPGYYLAKRIIRAICDVAHVINRDPKANQLMKVVFLPDYRVSLAEAIIPAADLSEQISTAGTEASGTSNMKFAMNGALTIGTLDGANIEIRDAVGADNVFIFGLTVEQIRELRYKGDLHPNHIYEQSTAVRRILDTFRDNRFCTNRSAPQDWIFHKLRAYGEPYFHLRDLEPYLETHDRASQLYLDSDAWSRKAILNIARMARFSSDRTIRDYAQQIWNAAPVNG